MQKQFNLPLWKMVVIEIGENKTTADDENQNHFKAWSI